MPRKISFQSSLSTFIERTGNALPHPAFLFGILALLILLLSWIGSMLNWHALHPVHHTPIHVQNLLNKDGLHRIISDFVKNYVDFAPLGIVLVAIMGLAIAEESGLISALLRLIILRTNKKYITFFIVLAGVMSNLASDIGYVLIIPLAGMIFHALGRHPIAGIAAAFAGVSGGFSANLLIGTTDPLLAGISTEAARIIDPHYTVLPTSNYYFMAASTILLCLIATWITHRYVEPRLGSYTGSIQPEPIQPLSRNERKGLRWTLLTLILWTFILLAGFIPEQGLWRDAKNSILHSPLLKGFVTMLFFIAGSLGVVYGFTTRSYTRLTDILRAMNKGLQSIIPFMVIVFFAAQFVAWFRWSNLGMILAIEGAHLLAELNLGIIPLTILFIFFSAFLNLFMGSASAKWALLAPVFIPMFMLLGYSPELTQAMYRIGDSATNIISPMMSFFALVITYYQRYDEKAGIGTLMSTMIPYSVAFLLFWSLFLILWIIMGLPLGPDANLYYMK